MPPLPTMVHSSSRPHLLPRPTPTPRTRSPTPSSSSTSASRASRPCSGPELTYGCARTVAPTGSSTACRSCSRPRSPTRSARGQPPHQARGPAASNLLINRHLG